MLKCTVLCCCCRPRRRSGSSIVVLDGDIELVKRPPEELQLEDPLAYNMVMMLAGESGPHREMAVDVPDTFVARNKTPPRYPPPKPAPQVRYDRLIGVQYGPRDQERAVDVPDSYIDNMKEESKVKRGEGGGSLFLSWHAVTCGRDVSGLYKKKHPTTF